MWHDSKLKPIPILPIARMCGITLRNEAYVEVEGKCPYCRDRKYRMYLNTRLNTFYCHNCTMTGNGLTLYANFFLGNEDYKEAYRILTQDKIIGFQPRYQPAKQAVSKEPTVKPLAARHDAYYDLLSMLSLSVPHWNNLISRGLSAAAIGALMYKTAPTGVAADRVAEMLGRKHDLEGIPGFYMNAAGQWRMRCQPGVFIPLCDDSGYIQGLQIRLDDVDNGKFRLFSSRYDAKGSRAHPYLHVTGDTGAQTAILMEGAMKADIMNYFTVGKRLFIAQAGAGNQKHVIPLLQRLGVSRVSIGYDMDRLTNPHIQRHVESLVAKLNDARIAYRLAQWDSSFNGMDDYALHVLKQKAA